MDNKQEYQELLEAKTMIESRIFQSFIMEPLYKELEKLKCAYDCKTITEMATLRGKSQGLRWLINQLDQIHTDFKNKKDEVETLPVD
jgi:hypothetical protein